MQRSENSHPDKWQEGTKACPRCCNSALDVTSVIPWAVAAGVALPVTHEHWLLMQIRLGLYISWFTESFFSLIDCTHPTAAGCGFSPSATIWKHHHRKAPLSFSDSPRGSMVLSFSLSFSLCALSLFLLYFPSLD